MKLIFKAEEQARRERPSAGVYDTIQHWSGGNTIFSPAVMNLKDYTCAVADYLAMNLKGYKDLPNHPETGARRPHPLEGGNGYMYRRMMGRNVAIDEYEHVQRQMREAAQAQAQEAAQNAPWWEQYQDCCGRCGGINSCPPGWCYCTY